MRRAPGKKGCERCIHAEECQAGRCVTWSESAAVLLPKSAQSTYGFRAPDKETKARHGTVGVRKAAAHAHNCGKTPSAIALGPDKRGESLTSPAGSSDGEVEGG